MPTTLEDVVLAARAPAYAGDVDQASAMLVRLGRDGAAPGICARYAAATSSPRLAFGSNPIRRYESYFGSLLGCRTTVAARGRHPTLINTSQQIAQHIDFVASPRYAVEAEFPRTAKLA